jgi:hypothetical protein
MITRARRLILDPQSPLSSKLTVLTGACFAFAFLVYGNVQEVFYVQSLQFLFFTVVALTAAEGTAVTSTGRRPSPFVSLIGAAIIFSSHLAWEYLYPGTTARWLTEPREYGCYPAESAPSGASYRWCGERSLTLYPAPSQGAPLVLKLEAGPIAQTITIQAGNSTAEVRLKAGEHRRVELLINPTEFNSSWIPTRLASNASFVPRLLWPSSADRRRLAFKQIY